MTTGVGLLIDPFRQCRPSQIFVARAFSDEVDTGSSQKMRKTKKLQRRSGSIGSQCALAFEPGAIRMIMPLKSIVAATILAASISASAAPLSAASFSCMNYEDLNDAELTICTDHRLGALDERLDSWYRRALVRAGYFQQTSEVRQRQLNWLADRNSCGDDTRCLKQAYYTRIGELKRYVEHV